jgi:hypothetical protein
MSKAIAVLATGMLAGAIGGGPAEVIASQVVVVAAMSVFEIWRVFR